MVSFQASKPVTCRFGPIRIAVTDDAAAAAMRVTEAENEANEELIGAGAYTL